VYTQTRMCNKRMNNYKVHSQNSEKRLLAYSRLFVCLSVLPFFCIEQLGPPLDGFHEIWQPNIFRKFVEQIQAPLKSDKNNSCVMWRPIYILDRISLSSSSTEKCFRQDCRENQNTHFMFNNFFELRSVYMRWYGKILYCWVGHGWRHRACALNVG